MFRVWIFLIKLSVILLRNSIKRLHLWYISDEPQWFAFNLIFVENLAFSNNRGLFFFSQVLLKLAILIRYFFFRIKFVSLRRNWIIRISLSLMKLLWILILNCWIKPTITQFKMISRTNFCCIYYIDLWFKFILINLVRLGGGRLLNICFVFYICTIILRNTSTLRSVWSLNYIFFNLTFCIKNCLVCKT